MKIAFLCLIIISILLMNSLALSEGRQIGYGMFAQPDRIREELKNIKWDTLADNIKNDRVDWEVLINSLPSSISAETQRILRNMPFAVVGYGFKSNDLLTFYSQFTWYKINAGVKSNIEELSNNGVKFHFMAKNGLFNRPAKTKNSVKLTLLAEHQASSLFNGPIEMIDFVINNSFAYILDRTGRILVVDISNPEKPQKIDLISAHAGSIFLSNNYLYAAKQGATIPGDQGMTIYDVTESGRPKQIGYLPVDNDFVEHVYVKNDIAYINGRDLQLIDVKNKTSPKILRTYKAGSPIPETQGCHFEGYRPRCINVRNSRLLIMAIGTVVCGGTGNRIAYEIADIGNSSQPIYMGSLPEIYGDFLAGSDSWIMIGSNVIDISEPDSPIIVDKQSICENCRGGNGPLVTTVDRSNRNIPKILLIDISNPLLPIIVGNAESPAREGYIWKQQIIGDLLYLLTGNSNNRILIYRMK